MTELSGYRFMWLLVMFDLPVVEEIDRKRATKFRNLLLNSGFQMANFSVYLRPTTSLSQAETLTKQISSQLPPKGSVSILKFTDKQYEQMVTFRSEIQIKMENPTVFTLF